MFKFDFGSGYNPQPGWCTCDVTMNCDFYFDKSTYRILDISDNSVDFIRMRNVLHHIPDIQRLLFEFERILKPGGKVIIIDINPHHYKTNFFLDWLWYRWIYPRYEVWFSRTYRDIKDYLSETSFVIVKRMYHVFREIIILEKQLYKQGGLTWLT